MFVMTAKLSKSKLIAICAGVVLVIAALVALAVGRGTETTAPEEARRVSSNEERVAFLAEFGWSVNAEPEQAERVTIPMDESDPVFARYNELQKSQGYDLSAFAGKEVMRYVYEILNYPNATSKVYASILVYDKCVIGGDVTCSGEGEPMHGLSKPS